MHGIKKLKKLIYTNMGLRYPIMQSRVNFIESSDNFGGELKFWDNVYIRVG
jgi:hypothetical protein